MKLCSKTDIKFICCSPTLPVEIEADAREGKAGPEAHCLCNCNRESLHSLWVSCHCSLRKAAEKQTNIRYIRMSDWRKSVKQNNTVHCDTHCIIMNEK